MPNSADSQKLREELADKEAMLRNIDAGNISLGNPWEGRADALRARVAELKSIIEKQHA